MAPRKPSRAKPSHAKPSRAKKPSARKPKAARPAPAAPARGAAPENQDIRREVKEDFEERQNLSQEGTRQLARRLNEHNSLSPKLSAGDVDAAWDLGRESGEETFTGHAPTPDQDVVDEMGDAAGVKYRDDEPLNYGKISERDHHRWELDARSGREEQGLEDLEEADEDDEEDDEGVRFHDLADDLDEEVEEDESESEYFAGEETEEAEAQEAESEGEDELDLYDDEEDELDLYDEDDDED
jgi:hypothetical protein